MADIIQLRRDTAANWTSADPILAQGEMGIETDTGQGKVGDGVTAWTSLGYNFQGPTGSDGTNRFINVSVISTNTTAVASTHYHVDTGGVTLTLPATPTVGDEVFVTVENFSTTIVARNGENITGDALDFEVDIPESSVGFRYVGAPHGWAITESTAGDTSELGVPSGGTANQVLAKIDGANYNTQWADPVQGVPAGGNTDQILTKLSGTDYDYAWNNPPESGQGAVSFTATDAITVGDPVARLGDGTVQVVGTASNPASVSSLQTPYTTTSYEARVAYDDVLGQVVTVVTAASNAQIDLYVHTLTDGTFSAPVATQNASGGTNGNTPCIGIRSSDRTAAILYRDLDNSNLKLQVAYGGTTSYSNWPAATTVVANVCLPIACYYLPSHDKWLLIYLDNNISNRPYGRLVSINGSGVVTLEGSATELSSAGCEQLSSHAAHNTDTDEVLFAGRNTATFDVDGAHISISGTTINTGGNLDISGSTTVDDVQVGYVGNSKYVVVYKEVNDVTARVVEHTGSNACTVHATTDLPGPVDSAGHAVGWDETGDQFVVYYEDTTNSNRFSYVTGTFDGNHDITFGTPVEMDTGDANNNNAECFKLPDGRLVITAEIGNSLGAFTHLVTGGGYNTSDYIGIAQTTVADGQQVDVAIGTYDNNQSGLTQGTDYWLTELGALTDSDTGFPYVGRAFSPTGIHLESSYPTTSSEIENLVVIGSITEQEYSLGAGTELNPTNGTFQYVTLSGNTTFTETLANGQYMTLMIDDGSGFTVTWPTITWFGGSAPTLETAGYNVIALFKINGVLYGNAAGVA